MQPYTIHNSNFPFNFDTYKTQTSTKKYTRTLKMRSIKMALVSPKIFPKLLELSTTFPKSFSIIYKMLNYCNFEVYLLIIPDVPIGRIICISLYPDVPIKRITKIHEEKPSVVSRVISTLIIIILSCLSPPREVGQINFSGANLVE